MVLQATLQHRPTPLTPQAPLWQDALEVHAVPGARLPPVVPVVPVVVPEVEPPVVPPVVPPPVLVPPVVPPVLVVVVLEPPHPAATRRAALIKASREPRI